MTNAIQVVQNACATQAILSILLNQDGKIELGKELEAFQVGRNFALLHYKSFACHSGIYGINVTRGFAFRVFKRNDDCRMVEGEGSSYWEQ